MYLTVMDCQELFNGYIGQLSPVTINDIRRRLKVVIGAAVEQGLIRKNVASLTRPIHEPKRKSLLFLKNRLNLFFRRLMKDFMFFRIKRSCIGKTFLKLIINRLSVFSFILPLIQGAGLGNC